VGHDVLIVGAGIVGLCTALSAAERGLRVTVVDRGGPADLGCSFGNAGMIVPSHMVPLAAPGMVALGLRYMLDRESPFHVRPRPSLDLLRWGVRFWRAANARHVARASPVLRDLHLASRACFEELARDADFGLVTRGLLMLCRTAHGLEEEAHAAEHARSLGVPAEVLGPEQAQALEPNLRLTVAGGVHYPLDAHLDPARLMAALRERAERAGVRTVWNAAVTAWRAPAGRVDAVRTTQGEMAADEFVLAAGVWSDPVARDLGLSLPMQAGKGYSLTLPEPRRRPQLCAILSEARVAVTPMGRALRFGGTMELTGIDTTVDPARVRGIVKSVPRYFPDFDASDFERVPAWCGLRPCSPDGLPYLGRTRRFANLSVATGHSMMGVSLGPITGRLMADVLTGQPPSIDIGALSPDRYSWRSSPS
jgi:D-amino-acid dehydrogenase